MGKNSAFLPETEIEIVNLVAKQKLLLFGKWQFWPAVSSACFPFPKSRWLKYVGAKRGCHSSWKVLGKLISNLSVVFSLLQLYLIVIFLSKHYNFSQGTVPEGLLHLLGDSWRKEGDSSEDMQQRIYDHFSGILWVCAFAIVLLHLAFFSQSWQFPLAMSHFARALTPSHNTVTLNTFTILHIPSLRTGRFTNDQFANVWSWFANPYMQRPKYFHLYIQYPKIHVGNNQTHSRWNSTIFYVFTDIQCSSYSVCHILM